MRGSPRRSVAENPRNGSKRICLVCASWEPTSPTSKCSHPNVVTLHVDDLEFEVLSGLAEAAARAERERSIALGALGLRLARAERNGHARVQATHVDAGNVVSLKLRRASVRVG